jgi:hypothetical protein
MNTGGYTAWRHSSAGHGYCIMKERNDVSHRTAHQRRKAGYYGKNGMPSYLVTARIRLDKLDELEERLIAESFNRYPAFGDKLSRSLKNAVMIDDMTAVWEEESSGDPPLREERGAVLDTYFDTLAIKEIRKDIGWEKIRELPRLFPDFR